MCLVQDQAAFLSPEQSPTTGQAPEFCLELDEGLIICRRYFETEH